MSSEGRGAEARSRALERQPRRSRSGEGDDRARVAPAGTSKRRWSSSRKALSSSNVSSATVSRTSPSACRGVALRSLIRGGLHAPCPQSGRTARCSSTAAISRRRSGPAATAVGSSASSTAGCSRRASSRACAALRDHLERPRRPVPDGRRRRLRLHGRRDPAASTRPPRLPDLQRRRHRGLSRPAAPTRRTARSRPLRGRCSCTPRARERASISCCGPLRSSGMCRCGSRSPATARNVPALVAARTATCRSRTSSRFAELSRRCRSSGARSDIAVVPSDTCVESFSMATLEAMACGVPVVATRNGGIPEVLADGETGTIVPPGDPAALAGAIRAYATDPGLRRRQAARRASAHVGISGSKRQPPSTSSLFAEGRRRREAEPGLHRDRCAEVAGRRRCSSTCGSTPSSSFPRVRRPVLQPRLELE